MVLKHLRIDDDDDDDDNDDDNYDDKCCGRGSNLDGLQTPSHHNTISIWQ